MTSDEFYAILDQINRDDRHGRISAQEAEAQRLALILEYEKAA